MVRLIVIALVFHATALFGQEAEIPKAPGAEALNMQEAERLNTLLDRSRGTFDFQGKRAAFITSSAGNRILAKADYFGDGQADSISYNQAPQISMVELTRDEKNRSGGYDVLVLCYVKVFTDRQKRRIIERLSEGSQSEGFME